MVSDLSKDEKIADLLTDNDTSKSKEADVIVDGKVDSCPECGFTMHKLQACKMRCSNCGAVQDCSDMGLTW